MAAAPPKKLVEALLRWKQKPSTMVRELFGATPDPWQEEALDAYPGNPRLAMKSAKGPGKAQPKDTVIPTPSGFRRFGDLKVGDNVFAGDGSVTTVTAIFDRGILPTYRVIFDDGSGTVCCGDHLWSVRGADERRRKYQSLSSAERSAIAAVRAHRRWGSAIPLTLADGLPAPAEQPFWSVLSTDQIIQRGVRVKNGQWAGRQFEIPRQGAAEYPTKVLPLDPYVLGVWLGDGSRLAGKYATKPTPEIAEEIRRRGFEVDMKKYRCAAVYGIRPKLRELGILHLYSHERFVPAPFLEGDVAQRRDLLCGLMDTDGGIDADGHMQFSSTSGRLADDVMFLARSLGGSAHRAKIKSPFYYRLDRTRVEGKPCHRVVLRLPFNPFRIESRKERWRDPATSSSSLRYMTRMMDRIEESGTLQDCMCIQVAHPSALYLTNDFIVTHNSTTLSWIGWNFLLTRRNPKCVATSISGGNLRDGLWSELAKWRQKAPLLQHMFEQTTTRIFAKEAPETWFMSARTWPQKAEASAQAETLAGIHADYVLVLMDESGAMPDAIMPTVEAVLAGTKEGHIVQAGNPTQTAGPLYRAFRIAPKLWYKIEITGDPDDPKRSERIPLQLALDQIEQYGRTNPWVIVNIFGEFPAQSLNVLIGPDEVRAAMKRYYREFEIGRMPKIMAADVARFGDDASFIAKRQGIQMFPGIKKRNLTSDEGAALINREWTEWNADACFVDATGGFGSGWIDQLRLLGRTAIEVQFAGKANNSAKYANKRAEIALEFTDWIKKGGALFESDELLRALTETTYTFSPKDGRLILEDKGLIKAKIGFSPDEMDACMMTFAEPISPKATFARTAPRSAVGAYDAFAEVSGNNPGRFYDPFAG